MNVRRSLRLRRLASSSRVRRAAFALVVAPFSAAAAQSGTPRAAHAIARGAILSAADIAAGAAEPARALALRPAGVVAPGWVARRIIAAGEPLVPPAVAPPPVVHAGDSVSVSWNGEQVRLVARGTAARSAAVGERLVVLLDGGRRVEAIATADGEARIP